MKALIKAEWLKMKGYNAFWWVLLITALAYPGINYIFYQIYDNIIHNPGDAAKLAKALIGNPFSFPDVWHTVAYASSLFIFIPSILVIMFITNEYSYKTHRQNIIDGWSRAQFMTSKMIDVLIISLLITLIYIIVCLVSGFMNQERLIQHPWEKSYYIGLFFLQTFSQLSFAFLVGFLVKKAFISLSVFLGYYFLIDIIVVAILNHYVHDIGRFLPMEVSDRIIPVPAFMGRMNPVRYEELLSQVNLHIYLTIGVTALIWYLCFYIHKRRDL